MVVAILAIPPLIGLLGTERFGILALAWAVMGYFGLFDFGLGRATTKFVAEHRSRDEHDAVARLVWTSVAAHTLLGLLGGVLLALLAPYLTNDVLNVPARLLDETRATFYLLALSVPLLVITAALRGVLEAIQRFDLVNAVRAPASIANYLGPLPILLLVDSLTAVMVFLAISRAVALAAYTILSLRALPSLSMRFRLEPSSLKPLLELGGWLTVSGFVIPTVVALDRFVVGGFDSLSAVTYYTTPYEVVTKMWIFSASLLAVLFPAFSALAAERKEDLQQLYSQTLRFLIVLVAPMAGVLLALAYDLLSLWAGTDIAQNSAVVAKWLAVGVLIHAAAAVPINALQGTGRASAAAKVQLALLPPYALALPFVAGGFGIVGVAILWTLRIAVEAAILFAVASRSLRANTDESKSTVSLWSALLLAAFMLLFLGVDQVAPDTLSLRMAAVAAVLVVFLVWEWLFFLRKEDRRDITKGVRLITQLLRRANANT